MGAVSVSGVAWASANTTNDPLPSHSPQSYWVDDAQAPSVYACHGGYQLPHAITDHTQSQALTSTSSSTPQPIYLLADSAQQTPQHMLLQGNVEVTKGNNTLTSDQVEFTRPLSSNGQAGASIGQGTASGNVALSHPDYVLLGSHATFNNNLDTAQITNAQHIDFKSELRTKADTINVYADDTVRIQNGQLTFCPPGDNSWHIDASNIRVYPDKGVAEMHNAMLTIGDVPVFYLPWMSIPIDDQRRSGFLFPKASINSQDGLHLAAPYYANLAPNYDATITPHWREKRGTSITLAARHLNQQGGNSRFNSLITTQDTFTNTKRWYANYQYQGAVSDTATLNINLARASDIQLFDDYQYPVTHADDNKIESHWQLTYQHASPWLQTVAVGSRVYQQLTTATPTYNQRAYVRFKGAEQSPQRHWQYQLDWRDFNRDNTSLSGTSKINGQRLHITPSWQQRWQTSYGYVKTQVNLPITHYQLQDHRTNTKANPSRQLYQLILDAGLWFDRPLTNNKGQYNHGNQTLEPRIYWTYTPYQAQDDLPVFDTSIISQPLYQPNRFSGADRIGDTHRVTVALISRVTNDAGAQTAKYSLAQIHYLQDRKVQLPNTATQTDTYSPIYASADFQITPHLSTQLNIDWQPKTSQMSALTVGAQYQSGQEHYFNLHYTKNSANEKQIKASAIWPIAPKWTGFVHNTTHLETNQTLQQALGVEYTDCCWALRLVGHDWLDNDSTRNRRAIYVEMSLKGLDTGSADLSNTINQKLTRFTQKLPN